MNPEKYIQAYLGNDIGEASAHKGYKNEQNECEVDKISHHGESFPGKDFDNV